MIKIKNEYIILRISESTLGTSKWWLSVIVQEKKTGDVYVLRDYEYNQLMFFMSYGENDVDDYRHSNGISLSGNKFFKKEISKNKPSTEEEIETFISSFTDREKIKQKIKQNIRDIKLNNLI
jgi:hypothetical protein